MKGDISYRVWVEVTQVEEGEDGQDPRLKQLLDLNSSNHGTLEGALEAGISSLIAAKHQRAKEMEDAMRLMPIWFTGVDPAVIDPASLNRVVGSSILLPEGAAMQVMPKSHASGLDDAPEPEGRKITDVELPKFDATELDGIRDNGDAPEPLPQREPIEEGDKRGHRYSCSDECAASGHTLAPHTIFKASGDLAAQYILDAAQPGESRVVVVEP